MWGLLHRERRSLDANGFIPTHVGFTENESQTKAVAAVHPHTCGVYGIDFALGLTGHLVHPHTCGVYNRLTLCVVYIGGSSPHMWGLHWNQVKF